jgi:multicomponent Na+:H+ antiporter subunit D
VAFGLAPDLLVAVLPGGVSASSAFSASKLTDAAAITAVGVAGFAVIRRPLARVTAVPDLDRLFHPAGRLVHDGTSRAVADAGARLHRVAARTVAGANAALSDPDRLDEFGLGRASIGTGVSLLTLVAALALVVLAWMG